MTTPLNTLAEIPDDLGRMNQLIEGFRTLGETGLRGAKDGMLYEEFIPELRLPVGPAKYREMVDNDPVIGGAIYATTMILRRVKWTVRAADDSAVATDFQEWLHGALMEDMATPFIEVIENALSKLIYGFAPAEIIFKIRAGYIGDDAPRPNETVVQWIRRREMVEAIPNSKFRDYTIGVHKISPRGQETIRRWFFDPDGDMFALEQELQNTGRTVIIPRTKLCLFRNSFLKNNPEGRSLLRSAWVPYNRKKALEIAEGRLAIRTAGVAVIRVPGEILGADESDPKRLRIRSEFESALKRLAKDQEGGIMLSSDVDAETKAPLYDFEFVSPEVSRSVDMTETINRIDHRIATAFVSSFILLGGLSSGSFAMSKDMTDMLHQVSTSHLDEIEKELNRSVVERLWELNAFPADKRPTLVHGPVAKKDLEALGLFLSKLTAAGATLFPNAELINTMLTDAGLPELPKDLEDISLEDVQQENVNPNAVGRVAGDGTPPNNNLEGVNGE